MKFSFLSRRPDIAVEMKEGGRIIFVHPGGGPGFRHVVMMFFLSLWKDSLRRVYLQLAMWENGRTDHFADHFILLHTSSTSTR
jgi:hypothetical protein